LKEANADHNLVRTGKYKAANSAYVRKPVIYSTQFTKYIQ